MTAPVRVLFVCAAGMSSSLIKSKVEAEAQAQSYPLELRAIPVIGISPEDFASIDVTLVAPQVRGQMADLKVWADRHGSPIAAIGFQEYGLADAPRILEQIRALAQGPQG